MRTSAEPSATDDNRDGEPPPSQMRGRGFQAAVAGAAAAADAAAAAAAAAARAPPSCCLGQSHREQRTYAGSRHREKAQKGLVVRHVSVESEWLPRQQLQQRTQFAPVFGGPPPFDSGPWPVARRQSWHLGHRVRETWVEHAAVEPLSVQGKDAHTCYQGELAAAALAAHMETASGVGPGID